VSQALTRAQARSQKVVQKKREVVEDTKMEEASESESDSDTSVESRERGGMSDESEHKDDDQAALTVFGPPNTSVTPSPVLQQNGNDETAKRSASGRESAPDPTEAEAEGKTSEVERIRGAQHARDVHEADGPTEDRVARPEPEALQEEKSTATNQRPAETGAPLQDLSDVKRKLANPNAVVYVDVVENPGMFSDFAVREEMERVFPGKPWKAFFMANAGLRISGFKFQDEIDHLCSIDWNTCFPGKGKPFGGVGTVQGKIATDPALVATDVCILVPGTVNAEKISNVATREGYVGVEVVWLQATKNPAWHKRARLRMQTAEQRDDIIKGKGLRFAYDPEYAISWNVWRRLERCYNCQKRHALRGRKCTRPAVCPICAGKECGKACKSNPKCANCAGPHKVWSELCIDFLGRIESESHRAGVPSPPRWRGTDLKKVRRSLAPQPIRVPNVYAAQLNGQSFAQRATGRPPQLLNPNRGQSNNIMQNGGQQLQDAPVMQRKQALNISEEDYSMVLLVN